LVGKVGHDARFGERRREKQGEGEEFHGSSRARSLEDFALEEITRNAAEPSLDVRESFAAKNAFATRGNALRRIARMTRYATLGP
jgi:hypothetical protein